MKIKALLLSVNRIESQSEKKTASGIILPSTMKLDNVPLTGKVIQTGPGLKSVPIEVKPGDMISYKRDAVICDIDGYDLVDQSSVILIEEDEV